MTDICCAICAMAASEVALIAIAFACASSVGFGQILLMPSSISFDAAATASSMPKAMSRPEMDEQRDGGAERESDADPDEDRRDRVRRDLAADGHARGMRGAEGGGLGDRLDLVGGGGGSGRANGSAGIRRVGHRWSPWVWISGFRAKLSPFPPPRDGERACPSLYSSALERRRAYSGPL